MPHFFIKSEKVNGNIIEFSEDYRHLVKSLRLRVGEKLLLIDENSIQYETSVKEIRPATVVVEIEKKYPSKRELEFDLYLAQTPLRSDAQNLLIEKATELGVKGVYPILTDNCAVAPSIVEKKVEKWQKIMVESSKQCERAKIPTCFEPLKLTELLEKAYFDRIIAFCERNCELSLKNYLRGEKIQKGEKILVIIGGEGGFSPREFEYFYNNKKITCVTLGNLILRAETAVIIGLGNIIYEY